MRFPRNLVIFIIFIIAIVFIKFILDRSSIEDYGGYTYLSDKVIDKEGNLILELPLGTIHLMDNGNILMGYIIDSDSFLQLMSPDFEVIWNKKIDIHHSLEIGENNTILFLTRETHNYLDRDVEFDVVIKLNLAGDETWRWSTYDHLNELQLLHSPLDLDNPQLNLTPNRRGTFDYYHANSATEIPENKLSKIDKRFKKGNYVLSLSFANLVIIIDKDTNEIVWSWGPKVLDFMHTPIFLENGNILIFDNGRNRGYSRVIEIDPVKYKIIWEYKENPPESLFTGYGGSAYRLPNGNTLITSTVQGHVFEVTEDNKIVWQWYNPEIESGRRVRAFPATRISEEMVNKLNRSPSLLEIINSDEGASAKEYI